MKQELVVPDLVAPGLEILFVGINPGLRSAELGHHFAGHSNRFWKLLHGAGFTLVKFSPFEDAKLLSLGYGITNIVSRTTATAAELAKEEFCTGAEVLKELIITYRPKIVAYLGKDVYRHRSLQKNFTWGVQPVELITGVIDFVAPNPSGLNRMSYEEQLGQYQKLYQLANQVEMKVL